MSQYVEVPVSRLEDETLRALLEEYVTRDGTDYGSVELSLDAKVERLQKQIERGDVRLIYELDSEQWQLMERTEAAALLNT